MVTKLEGTNLLVVTKLAGTKLVCTNLLVRTKLGWTNRQLVLLVGSKLVGLSWWTLSWCELT